MQFSKMHGLGNDFMIIDAITQKVYLSPIIIRQLSNRHYGVGFDQLLLVEPPYNPELDFHYRIFNADGSETNQCGNGARCFAHFVHMKRLTNKRNIYVSTQNGCIALNMVENGMVRVNMGEPNLDPQKIPFKTTHTKKSYVINLANDKVICSVISIGNPHCVLFVDNIQTAQVETLGPILEKHNCFPEGANISFMQIIDCEHIHLRVYERGTGETQACGSAACAAAAVGILQGQLSKEVYVNLPGGQLYINWHGPGYPLYMTGPATHIYDGFINL